jgi:hypothetical protein
MKSFILGLGTLLALATATTPAAAQEQYQPQYSDDGSGQADPNAGADWNQTQAGGYAPGGYAPGPEAMAQQPAPGFGYFGPHPIANEQGGGFCQETGAHQHEYPVFDRNLFRVVSGYAYFTGDPSDFGYQGQGYVYRSDHPLDAEYGGGFCYMHWAHRHWFAPVSVGLAWDGGGYAFNGIWPAAYYANRPLYVNYYNDYYRRNYLGGGYSWRRPAPIYAGWGWHRPMFGGGLQRPGVYYRQPYGRPGYVNPGYANPGYRSPGAVYRAPAPMYRAPAPMYRAPAPMYRAPAPMYRAPAPMYRAPAPMYRAPAPAYHISTPAYRAPAPSYHSPAPMFHGGGGGGHFGGGGGGGGGGHFGGGGGGGGGGHFGGGHRR